MNLKIVFLLTLLAKLSFASYPIEISLNGNWQYKVDNKFHSTNYFYKFTKDDKNMKLPTNWYKAGINHSGVVWFHKKIEVSKEYKKRNIFLEFNGVDYFVDIWVNGKFVGFHEGYFQQFSFDISKFLKFNQKNSITLRVNSPQENIGEHFSLRKTIIKGVFSHHDTRAGGAWSAMGQDRNSGGVWDDVRLKIYDKTKIDNIKITPKLKINHSKVTITFDVKNFKRVKKQKVKAIIRAYNFKSPYLYKEVKVTKKNQIEFFIFNPKLWNIYERGKANLYELTLQIGDLEVKKRFGIRDIRVDKNEIFYLNNKALFLRGTNYISTHYLSEMSREKFKKDIALMKKANINIIRVHSHIEPKEFYELCDEEGILVWQDNNLQWGYSEKKEVKEQIIKQTYEMVDTLYNHPSIIVWSLHNEPPWDSPWMKWKYSDYNKTQNKKLDDTLFKNIKEYDKSRFIKKISSQKEHPWYGWYFGSYKLYAKPSRAKIISEFGAQAIPNLESLMRFIPKKQLFPKSKKAYKLWAYHNFQKDNTFKDNRVKKGKNIEEFTKNSQTYQANGIKYAVEMSRIQRYKNVTALFQFMFNEAWESINWGVIDYYRVPKKGYFALKEAYRPIMPIAKIEKNRIKFFVVNDLLKEFKNAELKYVIFKDNKIIKRDSVKLTVSKNSLIKIHPDGIKRVGGDRLELKLILDKKIVKNSYNLR